jgi:hypothetical protein
LALKAIAKVGAGSSVCHPALRRFLMKTPTMVIYWADTRIPLTYAERSQMDQTAIFVVAITPREVLLALPGGRKVVVRGVTDETAPKPPAPKYDV